MFYPIVGEEEKSKYRRKDDKENYVCRLVKRNFFKWDWEVVDIVPTNGDALSLATKIECDERKLALIYNYINGNKNVIRRPGMSFKIELTGAPRITFEMISAQQRIDQGEYPTEPYRSGSFKTWWQRRKEQEEFQQTQERCKTCDFYSGQKELLCAVHPVLQQNCTDFQPKQNRQRVLEITRTRKLFRTADFTRAEFLYCFLVLGLDDWTDNYYCTRALVEKFSEIRESTDTDESPWDLAYNLSIEKVTNLQERLSSLSSDDRYYFTRAINTFIAIG